ncbi:MAG: tRNA (adenosine(37)-N6)-threonylcarbamoyltransferase complex dimerization subunit type 1 TsaB [Erythrobacter sp.]|nr:tRNA (adenosine(37)-N6)-threonylcarbamoyltransferase complex dimerization subunit type 1 TsaB [Erythrobacter sp.]
MRTLTIECASEACSIALFDGERLVAHDHRLLGRGHAESLVPMIADLPDKGRATRILVSRGPGSFTGVRIGIAAARALGIAWHAEVLGYPTLALVAAIARTQFPDSPVSIAMRGGHGEVFVQNFDAAGMPQDEADSLSPGAAAQFCQHAVIAGTMAPEIANLKGAGTVLPLHPDARHVLTLAPALITQDTAPIYGRGPDARLPAR